MLGSSKVCAATEHEEKGGGKGGGGGGGGGGEGGLNKQWLIQPSSTNSPLIVERRATRLRSRRKTYMDQSSWIVVVK